MKKKIGFSLFAVFLVAFSIMGTVAYFSKSFTSDGNVAKAASFEVDTVNSQGTTIGNAQFNLSEKLYPGMDTVEAYSFSINKNNTEVPVEYKVNLTPSGDLFPQGSTTPVVLEMKRKIDNNWVKVDYTNTFKPASEKEEFKIYVSWPHGNNDIAFQGKSGNIKLEVVATQVDKEVVPEEPAGPPYFTGAVEFKATPNGSTFKTTNKEINFYKNAQGFRVFEILMGSGTGTFEEKVGKVTVTEEIVNGITYYRVITAKEYYASPSQIWRARAENVDTSKQGTVKFQATLAPYLLIESDAFYKWFTN
ncbi:hypothetical protein ACFSO7_02325 [Bacillus sp. CGMCC 1.16607]|uniref:hypothetical protein n=1 Tax=Bacillus sp. CGMCC 1.16607 TaxID=3351842 RepID=UPI0036448D60